MKSEVILVANEGQTIPPVLAQKILANNTSAIGAALVHPEEGFVIDSDNSGASLKEWTSHQTDFKGQKVFYHFCESAGEKVATEDLQPFRTVVDGKDTKVVTFAVGAFEIENDGQFSDAHVFHETYLRPMIEDMYAASGKDLDKLAEMLDAKTITSQMKMLVSPNKSTIAILLANGTDFLWTKADRTTIAPWGFTSDNYGVKEEPAANAQPKKRFGGVKEDDPPAEIQPVAPTGTPPGKDEPVVLPAAAKAVVNKGVTASDLVASGAASAIPVTYCVPNPNMGMRKKKDWYKEYNNGIVPDNVERMPPIPIPTETAMKLSKTRTMICNPQPDQKAHKEFGPAMEDFKKNVTSTHIPATPPPKPVVSSIEVTKKMGEVLQSAKPVTDPKEWETLENKYPNLYSELGLEESKVIFASVETREALIGVDAKKCARAWMHESFKRMEAVQYAQQLEKKVKDLEAKVPAAAAAEPPKKRFGGIKE